MTERTHFLKALVGSHNYNLNVPESDKDYKIFVLPTFDDMLHNRDFKQSYKKDENDYEYKDARLLTELWWKANVNFIEVLFSQSYTLFAETEKYMQALLDKKEEIARMNLPYLHRSTMGMIKTKLKLAQRNKEQGLPWGKEMMSAIRIGDFFYRYYQNGFTDFGAAMTYDREMRELMLKFRYEEFSFEAALTALQYREDQLKEIVVNYSEEEGLETKRFVEETLYEAVKESVQREFRIS